MPPTPFLKTAAYLRKSRADGEESVEEVLARHERMLQDVCVRIYQAPLPESRIFREIGSGETISSRPVIQKVIRLIQNGEIEGLLCVDLQRLSRGDLVDVGELSRLFLVSGCKILTPTKTFDVADEYDRKFFEMELMHGNDFLEYTKKIMSRGRKQSVLDGNYIGSRPPYGYDKITVDKRPTLAPNPKEADVVRMIFDLYGGSERIGPERIADRLNQMGIPPQRNVRWTPASVRNIIENPIYIGKLRWNNRKIVKEYRDGQIVESRPRNDNAILADGKHEPIIDLDVWERAQAAAESRAHPSAHRSAEIVNPLSGLLTCSECGYKMAYKLCYDHRTRKPINPIFLCTTKNCPTRGAPVYQVMEILRNELIQHEKECASDVGGDPSALADEKTASIWESELTEIGKQREKLYDLLERGIYSEDLFLSRMEKLNAREGTTLNSLAALREKKKSAETSEKFRASLRRSIDLMNQDAPPAEVNRLLKEIVRSIEYARVRPADRSYTPINMRVFFT